MRLLRVLGVPSPFHAFLGLTGWLFAAGMGAANGFAVPASIDLQGARVFPENLTSTKDGTLYVGSLGSGGIIRIKPHGGKPELWIKPAAFGSRSIFGVFADEQSNTLWACSNDSSALGIAIASM